MRIPNLAMKHFCIILGIGLLLQTNVIDGERDEGTLTFEFNRLALSNDYKFMMWNENNVPVIVAITSLK